MESKFHRWWLGACVAALLLASWVGGFSVAVTAVFIVIYLTGVTLIGPDDEVRDEVREPVSVEPPPVIAPEPEPEPEPAAEAEARPAVDTTPETVVETTPETVVETTPETVVETVTETVVVTPDEDDAVPYPDDVEEEPVAGVEEPTPA